VAALHSVASGTARPLAEALEMSWPRIPPPETIRIALAALRSQGLAPLAAKLPDVERLSPELRRLLAMELEDGRASATALVSHLTRAIASLRADGCEVVVIGEVATALTVYREAGLRPVRKLDLLLVQRDDCRRAKRALDPGSPVVIHEGLTMRTFEGEVDLTSRTLDDPVARAIEGFQVLLASPGALAEQTLWTAASDFMAAGFPGVSAIDLRLLALEGGRLSPGENAISSGSPASLIHAVDAVERFCPGTFEPAFISRLAQSVPPARRELGRGIPPLRGTRPPGSPLQPEILIENRLRRLLFVLARNLRGKSSVKFA
jgi:hypothetical protein